MEVLEEINLTKLVNVLSIDKTAEIDFKQYMIDNDLIDCTVINGRPYYFGKKWTPSGYGWIDGAYTTEYRNGENIYSRCNTSSIPFIVVFDGMYYGHFHGYTLWKMKHKGLELIVFPGHEDIQLNIPIKETFDGIPLYRVGVFETGVNYEYDDNEFTSDDGYVYPHLAYPGETTREYPDLKKLPHNNPQVLWEFGDYYPITEAGYLTKSRREKSAKVRVVREYKLVPIGETKEKDYQLIKDIPVPSNIAEIFDQILQILPPPSAETALYNPKAYMDYIPEIRKILEKYHI